MTDKNVFVPKIDDTYVSCELSEKIEKILKTNKFFPILLAGETGTGKTFPVMQIAARLNRECIRLNITKRSNELNLMGGFRLVQGGITAFEKGPVVLAMERGAILLLDELDLADPEEILCLQSVMEGNGYYIKDINEFVTPKPGFTVIATANTKGIGDDSGKYIGTNILNEAFLERISVAFEVDYLDAEKEKIALSNKATEIGLKNVTTYIEKLVKWAGLIRSRAKESVDQHSMSMRRLIHILETYSIFKNEREAIVMCLSRFDEHHKNAFLVIWDDVIDVSVEKDTIEPEDSKNFITLGKLKPIK